MLFIQRSTGNLIPRDPVREMTGREGSERYDYNIKPKKRQVKANTGIIRMTGVYSICYTVYVIV